MPKVCLCAYVFFVFSVNLSQSFTEIALDKRAITGVKFSIPVLPEGGVMSTFVERRAYKRIWSNFDTELFPNPMSEAIRITCLTYDIGACGIRLFMPREPVSGRESRLRFTYSKTQFVLIGEVVWTRSSKMQTGAYEVGIMFKDITDKQKDFLNTTVEAMIFAKPVG